MIHRLRLAPLFLALAATASAHFVWLEQTPEGPAAFFGEWSDHVRETQDGYLKGIAGPRALAADGSAAPVEVRHDRLAVVAPSAGGDLRLTAHYRPEKGDTLVRYHARLGRTATTGHLDLELVPVAADSNTFTLIFAGQPLPGTDVTLFSASGWSRKFPTDEHGRVTVETPWPGQYVLEAAHLDKTPGELAGRAHQQVRHVATLTFTLATP